MDSLHDFNEETDVVLDVEDVVKLEHDIARSSMPLSVLMARAGAALAGAVRAVAPLEDARKPSIVVLCGSGNNGGDGWVCARVLAQAGYPVTVAATRAAADVTAYPAREAAQASAEALANLGCSALAADDERVAAALAQADVAVDALLGTGFSGSEVTGTAGALVKLLNESPAFVIAADVPSGLSAQTGEAAVPCAHADCTVTMLCAKTGMAKRLDACGRLLVAPLGVDVAARTQGSRA